MLDDVKNFFKSIKIAGRIFIVLWILACIGNTIVFLADSGGGHLVSAILLTFIGYFYMSAAFLIPAVTITQAQCARENHAYTYHSGKLYWLILFTTIFFGVFGIHRLCLKKSVTGIIYFISAGGLLVGWIVDIVLVAAGRFVDKNGTVVGLPRKENQKLEEKSDYKETGVGADPAADSQTEREDQTGE